MRYARLLALFARAELQLAFAYRADLLLDLFQQAVVVVTSTAAVVILYSHTNVINGWSFGQMIVLLGVYYLIQGCNSVFFETSFQRFMEQVRLGTLDFVLIKPADSQFMISTRHLQVAQAGQLLLGCGMIAYGIAQVDAAIGFGEAFSFAVSLLCGVALVYCLLLVLSTLAFWFVRVDNLLAIFWSFLDAGRFPVDIYPGWLRLTLSTIVPIGIAVTVPAQAITGTLSPAGLLLMLAGTVAVWFFAGWFWRFGVRNYTGASA